MTTYIAFLRGINVGGKAMIKMAELSACLSAAGLQEVRTYIQSGNIVFNASEGTKLELAAHIERVIKATFRLEVPTVVFSKQDWITVMDQTPAGWNTDPSWKYNMLILFPGIDVKATIADIGELKPGIETVTAGPGVLYQSMSRELYGKTTTGKLASLPVYKRMTIRNANTCQKIRMLLE